MAGKLFINNDKVKDKVQYFHNNTAATWYDMDIEIKRINIYFES